VAYIFRVETILLEKLVDAAQQAKMVIGCRFLSSKAKVVIC
jgi:hypothetical protein